MAPSEALAKEGSISKKVAMHHVCCLRSNKHPKFRYIGYSRDLNERLKAHNGGSNPSTSHFTPLHLEGYVAFREKSRALAFEAYLKSGSGHASANKRLW